MKKILFVVDNLEIGGVEKSLVCLVNRLIKEDYQISILPLREYGIYKDMISKKVNILPLPVFSEHELMFGSFKGQLFKAIKEINISKILTIVKLLFKSKKDQYTCKMSASDRIRCCLISKLPELDEKYDIAVSYIDRQYSYYVDKKVTASKKIMWVHCDYSALKNKVKKYKNIYSNFDNIVCVSNKAKDSFDLKFPSIKEKTININNMIDTVNIDNSKNKVFDKQDINIVTVGRLSKEKRYYELVDIFSNKYNDFKYKTKLYIIGDGPERKRIEGLIKERNMQDNIILLGAMSNPYHHMNDCQIYVQPSKKEGFCLSVYEALYMKKFIVAYDFSDLKQSVTNGVNGDVCNDDSEFENKLIEAVNEKKFVSINREISNSNYNDITIEKINTLFKGDNNEKNKFN